MIKDDIKADSSKVICPKCCHQFTAICLNDQKERSRALAEIERLEAELGDLPQAQAEMLTEIKALRAERDAAVADARRIDFLDKTGFDKVTPILKNWYVRKSYGAQIYKAANLREAIDAAIAKGEAQ